MSEVLGFSASLLLYLLYGFGVLAVAIAILLVLDKLSVKQDDKAAAS